MHSFSSKVRSFSMSHLSILDGEKPSVVLNWFTDQMKIAKWNTTIKRDACIARSEKNEQAIELQAISRPFSMKWHSVGEKVYGRPKFAFNLFKNVNRRWIRSGLYRFREMTENAANIATHAKNSYARFPQVQPYPFWAVMHCICRLSDDCKR